MDRRKTAALITAATLSVASGGVALAANLGLLAGGSAGAQTTRLATAQAPGSGQPRVVTVYKDVNDIPTPPTSHAKAKPTAKASATTKHPEDPSTTKASTAQSSTTEHADAESATTEHIESTTTEPCPAGPSTSTTSTTKAPTTRAPSSSASSTTATSIEDHHAPEPNDHDCDDDVSQPGGGQPHDDHPPTSATRPDDGAHD